MSGTGAIQGDELQYNRLWNFRGQTVASLPMLPLDLSCKAFTLGMRKASPFLRQSF